MKEVHPMVAALVGQWDAMPITKRSHRWEMRLAGLTSFVLKHGRLPTASWVEYKAYRWLQDQTRQFFSDKLPAEYAEKLRRAHPLIAEKLGARLSSGRAPAGSPRGNNA